MDNPQEDEIDAARELREAASVLAPQGRGTQGVTVAGAKGAERPAFVPGVGFSRPLRQPPSLAEYILQLLAANPDGELVELDAGGTRAVTRTGVLSARAHALCGRLEASGHQGRTTVVVCTLGVADFVAASWACLFSGFDFLPFDASAMTTNPLAVATRLQETVGALGDCVLCVDEGFRGRLERTGVRLELPVLCVERVDGPGGSRFARQAAPTRPSSLIISTSGTTGGPKFAVLGGADVSNRFYDGPAAADGRVCLYNLAHHSVAGVRLLLPLGRRTVYAHPLRVLASPLEWLDLVQEHGVTDIGLNSTLAAALCDALEGTTRRFNCSSLARISFGSEVIVPAVVSRLLRGLVAGGMREADVTLVYSMTETGPLFRSTRPFRELLAHLERSGDLPELDRCVPGWSLRIVDEHGGLLDEGQSGHIQVRSRDKLFQGYLLEQTRDHPAAPARWFDTGDVGLLREGRLTLQGRLASTIVVNSRKISCEQVESHLAARGAFPGTGFVVACHRPAGQAADEVVVFLVAEKLGGQAPGHAVADWATREISRQFGLGVRHVVRIEAAEVERTSTLKIKRNGLVEKFLGGGFPDRIVSPGPRGDEPSAATPYLRMWQEALALPFVPAMDQTFDELGGDSLAAVKLVSMAEAGYGVPVPLEEFYECPTPAGLYRLLCRSSAGAPSAVPAAGTVTAARPNPLHDVGRFVASWRGERQSRDSMIVGFNTSGDKPPIFWVLQSYEEARALAEALGPGQPLYAMRSAVMVIPTAEYSEEALRPILERYFAELRPLVGEKPFVLGGNCQAAIIALLVARRLAGIATPPSLLVLMEWSFGFGRYEGPVALLFGASSAVRRGREPEELSRRFAGQFPRNTAHLIPGAHGCFFDRENVSGLARKLRGVAAGVVRPV